MTDEEKKRVAKQSVYFRSSEDMREVETNSVNLIVSSPPYNVGKAYERKLSDKEYVESLVRVLKECKRVLKPDGRICWNVAGMVFRGGDNKDFFSPFRCSIEAFELVELQIREFVTWDQLHIENNGKTAWGSWRSASSPYIRHQTEKIIIGFKDVWKRQTKGISTISSEEFQAAARDVWYITPETTNRLHPAPFPVALPIRCINFLTYKYDVVLDPFLGSGTTLLACRMTDREGIGYEINREYEPIITKRALLDIPNISDYFEPNFSYEETIKKKDKESIGSFFTS